MTDAPEFSLAAWRRRFAEIDFCPWPGPRPLTVHDGDHLLCGRDDDRQKFLHEVRTHKLVFLTGSSGVGKTSLLQNGLIPELQSAGHAVAVCREWSGTATEDRAAEYLGRNVFRSLNDPDLPANSSIFKVMANERKDRYGERAVIVLDQFEELIRDAPRFKDRLFDVLGRLNHHSPIKLIISLRSEYLHELRDLEHKVEPFTLSHYYLEEIQPNFALDVIRAEAGAMPTEPLGADLADADAAEPEDTLVKGRAAELIADTWKRATQVTETSAVGAKVGLLHLQAFLYALHSRTGDDGPIDADAVERLMAELSPAPRDPAAIFLQALEESVEVKLRRCRQASIQSGHDRPLVEGATEALARSAAHLSSAGYKLVRDARDLADAAIGTELAALRRGIAASRASADAEDDGPLDDGQYDALFETVTRLVLPDEGGRTAELDLLTTGRSRLAQAADRRGPLDARVLWQDRLHPGSSSLDADQAQVTSGSMLGRAPAAVLIEELRRFALALEWLQAGSLARLSTPGVDTMMVALIHDGFGRALERWSRKMSHRTGSAIHALTAPLAEEFVWPTADGEHRPEFDGETSTRGARYLFNLRWRGAFVQASFRSVVFANCDFRGSYFNRCRFEGVVFVNCLLDGVMFSDCVIAGSPSPAAAWREDDFGRDFVLDRSGSAAALLARYADDQVAGHDVGDEPLELLADRTGLPARALPSSAMPAAARRLAPETGSLVIAGGRLSSITARANRFVGDAWLCLRETAGSGFDVTDHQHASNIEISGSSVRHLTFTSSPTVVGGGEPINVKIDGSAVFQVWIGHDLEGRFEANYTRLIHVWNGSPSMDAVATDCAYHGLTGVAVDADCNPMVPDEHHRTVPELDPKGDVRRMALAMDYRRNPSVRQQELVEP